MSLFLFIVGIIAAIIGIIFFITDYKIGGTIIAIIGALFIIISCICSVPTGHTGIVTSFGRVEDYTLEAGIHFKAPYKKVVKMDNRTQKGTLKMSCFSSDIQEVKVQYTLNYCIQKSNAQTIYKTIGKDYYETVVTPCIQEALKVVTAKYNAEDLIGSRSQLALEVESNLSEQLKKYNIKLIDTSIENMDFTDAFENAVEEKQVAAQNKLKAETQAEQKVIEAEAEANAKIIKANAEAKANDTLSKSLTDKILYQKYIEKWNGKLPQVAGADASTIIGSLTGNKE